SEPERVLMEGHYLVGNQGIFKVQEFLGEGAFGKVGKCSKLGSQEMYAIKIIAHVEEGMEEFESMKLIKALDPDENHLIKMYECFSFQNVICLVFEILEESLEDFLNKNKCKATPLTYVRAIAQQMFQALQALKSIGVVHCDIKLDNIMFADKQSLKFKLIDFGVAVETKELSTEIVIQVNPFRAPEVILGLPLDESVDMWALEEYTEATGEKLILEVNPERRITPSQALEHDFITMKHLSGKRCYQDEDVLEKSSSHKGFRRVLKFFRELLHGQYGQWPGAENEVGRHRLLSACKKIYAPLLVYLYHRVCNSLKPGGAPAPQLCALYPVFENKTQMCVKKKMRGGVG
uniref:Protein kinase domain-containing protein n=1 Tax=Oryzias latipes TaxID=8090 RepID=A0A3B3HWY0_ORYLA